MTGRVAPIRAECCRGEEEDVAGVQSYFVLFLPVDEATVSLLHPHFPRVTLRATSPHGRT